MNADVIRQLVGMAEQCDQVFDLMSDEKRTSLKLQEWLAIREMIGFIIRSFQDYSTTEDQVEEAK